MVYFIIGGCVIIAFTMWAICAGSAKIRDLEDQYQEQWLNDNDLE